MITGQEKPDGGTIKIGKSVQLGYVDQSRNSLDGKKNVWEEISNGQDVILLGKREMNWPAPIVRRSISRVRIGQESRAAFRR